MTKSITHGVKPLTSTSGQKKASYPARRRSEELSDAKAIFHRVRIHELRSFFLFLVFVIVAAILINQFVIQRNVVSGSSMYPTLHSGDSLLVDRFSPTIGRHPKLGQIITIHAKGLPGFEKKSEDLVKRVVGIPGDHILIKAGKVWRNGKPLPEKYLPPALATPARHLGYDDVHLLADEFYVLGDNRSNSRDSRYFGAVPFRKIRAYVLWRMYPRPRLDFAHFKAQ